MDRSDRVQELLLNRILQEVPASAGLKRTQRLNVAGFEADPVAGGERRGADVLRDGRRSYRRRQ